MRVKLNVVVFSYLSRPILDVFLGKRFVGVAGPYPESGRANTTGVEIDLGVQNVSWVLDGLGFADSGDTVKAANIVKLEKLPSDARYLGLHIYPDNTVELLPSRYFPELSPRGEAFDLEWRRKHGK